MSALDTAIDNAIDNVEVINVLDEINVCFYDLWLAEESHIIAKGGRSSMKSSIISMKLVKLFLSDPLGNVICLRKVAKYLRGSVYEQIKWAIYKLKVQDQFKFGTSPLKITHTDTNSAFYFEGVDDPQKLKGMTIAVGYVMGLWFEELAEFSGKEDIDIVEDTFIRADLGGKDVQVYFSYNPPKNPYAWVNEWAKEQEEDPTYFIHHSTYLGDEKGFLSKQIREKIERTKVNDPEYYRYMYLGEIIGLGTNIFKLEHVQVIPELPKDERITILTITSDTGHQVSATTHLCIGITNKRNAVLLDTYYYSPDGKADKMAPSEMSREYKQFYDSMCNEWDRFPSQLTIDSAEGALRNQIRKDYGLSLHPVAKGKKVDMIDNAYDLMAEKRFYMLDRPSNKIFTDEVKKYAWDEKTLKTDDPKPIKVDDHCMDAFQYFCKDNARALGLLQKKK
ncbi:PBSX family phage terminase large subunit [Bacillus thuringiensis]